MRDNMASAPVLTGALIRGARLRGDQYQCDRCGRINKLNQKADRKRVTTCRDCREVEAAIARLETAC